MQEGKMSPNQKPGFRRVVPTRVHKAIPRESYRGNRDEHGLTQDMRRRVSERLARERHARMIGEHIKQS